MVAQILLSGTHISIALGILTFIIGVITLVMKINKNYKELLDIKVDKVIFENHREAYKEHCVNSQKQFDEIYDTYNEIQREQNQLLKQLVEEYTEMRTDIKWIKQRIKD
jgi:hypothetical protein